MKVLVTGGAGFVGSNLVKDLINKDYSVLVYDDLSTGRLENLDYITKGDLEFAKGDICDIVLLREKMRGIDYVIHLAAMNRAPRSIEKPLQSNSVNVTGTLNVLLTARDAKVKKVLYTSSSSIYGDSDTIKSENLMPNPQTPYAVGKLTGEYYSKIFQKLYGLQVTTLRLFSVYGKKQRADLEYAAVIPKFIDLMKQDKQPTIFGDGRQTRPFTYVKDVVDAFMLFLENQETGVFNIATKEPYTISHLVSCINRILGKKIEPICVENRHGDFLHSDADISKAMKVGFNPKYNLEMGLRELIGIEK